MDINLSTLYDPLPNTLNLYVGLCFGRFFGFTYALELNFAYSKSIIYAYPLPFFKSSLV